MAWTAKGNIRGPQGVKGDTGNTGAQGAQGPAGAAGEVWYSGGTNPSGTLGAVGDWYLNTANGDVWEKTGSSTWTIRTNLIGPQGPAGAAGEKWFTGSGVPAGTLAGSAIGDWYLNSANGDYYEKTASTTWTLRGNLEGPQGPAGAGFNPAVDANFTASQSVTITDAGTNNSPVGLQLDHESSAAAAADFGVILQALLKSASVVARPVANIYFRWVDPLDASRTGKIEFACMRSGSGPTTAFRIFGDGSIGLNRGTTPHGIGNVDISGVYKTNGTQIGLDDLLATATNDNAAAGDIGQFISASRAAGSMLTPATGSWNNVTQISLPAGDWEVSGAVLHFVNGAAANAFVQTNAGISTTSAALDGLPSDAYNGYGSFFCGTGATSTYIHVALPSRRISLAATTTIYLVGRGTQSGGAIGLYGWIEARRVR